ncbi:hypothetical protein HNQ94_000431 [Salirhabdus euzebyi]|uniref:Uncharacterized protein n=1 Tax=Salirhabdus euzebyi TaxID=394506 RepID=A0A841PT84_9BACI|nr:hypothetical protein [Salirhabdus euzebyi]MBB6452010.1 hypothetical protein [Salirhabdus euzebyi]
MIYVMGKVMYEAYTTGKNPFTHEELIEHINQSFGLRETVNYLQVK